MTNEEFERFFERSDAYERRSYRWLMAGLFCAGAAFGVWFTSQNFPVFVALLIGFVGSALAANSVVNAWWRLINETRSKLGEEELQL